MTRKRSKRQPGDDPYGEFLSCHRQLAATADAVLERIVEFGWLKSKEDFQTELKRLDEEQAGKQKAPAGLYTAIERRIRPSGMDQLGIRRLALVCRAAEVALGHTPWHHQIICALLLNSGLIVEIPNGSGKTLATALSAACNSTSGDRTHVVTSNDYLSERDARWMGPLYQLLGLSVGVIFSGQSARFDHGILNLDGVTLRVSEENFTRGRGSGRWRTSSPIPEAQEGQSDGELTPPLEVGKDNYASEETNVLRHETVTNYVIDPFIDRRSIYQCDIVYGRLESFGLDYLQDNLRFSAKEQVITRRDMLIVDECDAVMMDELRTPLIITRHVDWRQSNLNISRHYLHYLAQSLVPGVDFHVAGYSINLTYDGLDQIKRLSGVDFYTPEACGLANGLVKALEALHVYHRDKDYIVENNQIVIIDQESGRLHHNRRYQDGLHEALEVMEGLHADEEFVQSTTIARTTIKHFVNSYKLVSGMSGVIGDPEEYRHIYGLQSISVQPYPPTRKDHPDLIYRTKRESRHAVVEEAIRISQRGQPVLINVPFLKDIDELSQLFEMSGVEFLALDARVVRSLKEEADYVRRAAKPGAITICSKLAARGTDIVISSEVEQAGGLYVIGLERGMDRRYDDQLRGRSGRHGKPGESVFILSLEDELMKIFAGERVKNIMLYLGMEENVAVESAMVSRRVEGAQKKVERNNRQWRRKVVERDDILERHRMVFYDLRQKILNKDDLKEEVLTMVDNWAYFKGQTVLKGSQDRMSGNLGTTLGSLKAYFDNVEVERLLQIANKKRQHHLLIDTLRRKIERKLEDIRAALSGSYYYVRIILLQILDSHWQQYLEYESSMLEESNLYIDDFASSSAKYANGMEERFDSFFYEVGEDALAAILGLTIQKEPELRMVESPAAEEDSTDIWSPASPGPEETPLESDETNE